MCVLFEMYMLTNQTDRAEVIIHMGPDNTFEDILNPWFLNGRYNIFLAFQEKNRHRMLDSYTVDIWPGLVFFYVT